jgi:hypothetical protein
MRYAWVEHSPLGLEVMRRELGMRMSALLVALSMLASATTASAECAWVLWKNFEVKTPAPTEPSGSIPHAADTRVQCENALARLWQSEVNGNQPGPEKPAIESTQSGPGIVIVNWKQGGGSKTEVYCLPDTVDPHGPKGGAR